VTPYSEEIVRKLNTNVLIQNWFRDNQVGEQKIQLEITKLHAALIF
jgi:hypothetical protein